MTDRAQAVALVLEQLTRSYPGAARPAVDALSLEVRPGELLALVGASGAGKSTTLRAVAGYEYPDRGRVLLRAAGGAERDVTRLPPERRGFGMVFQHHALFPHLSVGDNVAFGLEARGVKRRERQARAAAALAGVGLAGTGPRPVRALSGGEQQRVALARALVVEPSVLLLDEPLSSLDPALRAGTRAELRRLLAERQVTAVFVTHDQEDAFAVADRVALLDRGRLLQVDTPEALYARPRSRAVAEFVGRATLLPGAADGSAVTVSVGGVPQRAPRAGDPTTGPALAVLRPEQLELLPVGAPGAADAWPGTVAGRTFAGPAARYAVALAGGVRVEVLAPAGAAAAGERVAVRLRGGAAVALVPGDAPNAG